MKGDLNLAERFTKDVVSVCGFTGPGFVRTWLKT